MANMHYLYSGLISKSKHEKDFIALPYNSIGKIKKTALSSEVGALAFGLMARPVATHDNKQHKTHTHTRARARTHTQQARVPRCTCF